MKVLPGDCLAVMKEMPDESVDAIVTDPPYGLGFMGKEWDALPPGKEWADECRRVLKPGGHLVAFGGSRTYHRLAVAIEDAGFEIRDQLQWLYGSGFPKSHNLPGGFGTALKPAHEPIVLARKPLTGTVVANVQEYGTGALNVDGCRVEAREKTPFPVGDYGNRGLYGANGDRSDDPNPAGRWPANLILDPEAGAMIGPESRFFYTAKASSAERNAGLDGFEERPPDAHNLSSNACGRCGMQVQSNGSGKKCECGPLRETIKRPAPANHHPTVKPIDLMRWLVRLVTPPGGTVLDPFTGSGTTGIAAALEGFDFIGIEREAEYLAIAEARIEWWSRHEGDTAEILVRAGLAEKEAKKHEESGQLGLGLE